MLEHFDAGICVFLHRQLLIELQVNVNGTLILFQATYPLLKGSTSSPKFIAVSSIAGSITLGPSIPLKATPYGASKAALNFVVRKLHQENEGLGVWCS
jgi:NAD(P)-dependent dehydrogenase (short-subunit alcohol dehydrogenase family)